MNNQNTQRRQSMLLATTISLVIMFGASSSANAQTTYKVGDRIEAKVSGEWVEAEVRKVEANGSLYIRHNGSSGEILTFPDYVRPAMAAKPTDNRKNPGNQTVEQPTQTTNANANKYGTRDAQTCKDMKVPAKGAPSAALAKQYVI